MSRILVTGASGFIGRVLCQQLRTQGVRVCGLMRKQAEGPWDEVILSDLAAEPLPVGALAGVDMIFHLAGKAHALSERRQDEEEYSRINTEGTRNLLMAAKSAAIRRFIYFSSVKAMGEGGETCQDERVDCYPETPYGKSKLESERLVLNGGFVPEPIVVRLCMVYGLSRKGNLPRMIETVSSGHFPPLPEVENSRSMVHVDDAVQAALLAAEKPEAAGQIYIITDGQKYSTRQVYEWICGALDKPAPGWTVPIGILRLLAKAGDGIGQVRGRRFIFDSNALNKLAGSAVYSSTKIEQDLGFQAKFDLHSTLPKIVAYLGLK